MRWTSTAMAKITSSRMSTVTTLACKSWVIVYLMRTPTSSHTIEHCTRNRGKCLCYVKALQARATGDTSPGPGSMQVVEATSLRTMRRHHPRAYRLETVLRPLFYLMAIEAGHARGGQGRSAQ